MGATDAELIDDLNRLMAEEAEASLRYFQIRFRLRGRGREAAEKFFDEAIKAAGARTVLYMTWARQNAPESQQAITDAYTGVGRELGATVVPVGLAWQRFLRLHERPVLHDKDQSHPTVAGSYLAGCVFFAVLFQESPVGVDAGAAGLSGEDLAVLQEAAWRECRPATRGKRK